MVLALLVLVGCNHEVESQPFTQHQGSAHFVAGSRWNFYPGYDIERGYVDDYFVISFPITNSGTAAGIPDCKGGIGDEWLPILHLPSVEPGETRWVTGIMVPRHLHRGDDSQGVNCSSGIALR